MRTDMKTACGRVLLTGLVQIGLLEMVLAGMSSAQGTSPCPTQVLRRNPGKSANLICLVPQVFGAGGLVGALNGGPLDDTRGHSVHFQASSVRSFGPINAEIGVQLSQLPIAAPVTGFLFAGGVVTPTNSFGPILTDRAETLGRNKLFMSLSYQYFNFDKADGVDLKNFGVVFTHEPEPNACNVNGSGCVNGDPVYPADIVATQNRIDLKVHQVTIVGTYGVSDKFDISVAVPVLSIRTAISSKAHLINFEPPPVNHTFFGSVDPLNKSFSDSGNAFGMGDVTVRAKYMVRQGEHSAVAAGADFRLPSGDAQNFLGAGTWGFRPFVTISGRVRRISPHASAGVQGNGSSVLAGDVTTEPATRQKLPTVVNYSFGADTEIARKIGLSADFIGEQLLHGSKIRTISTIDRVGNAHPDIDTSFQTITLASVAAGVKLNPFSNLLITVNGLFRLNSAGLHAKPTPLVGLSYIF